MYEISTADYIILWIFATVGIIVIGSLLGIAIGHIFTRKRR